MLAPVVLFVYNRCDHVKQTLEALANNTVADQSDLYVFSDGPKNEQAVLRVNEVREFVNLPKWKEAFKSVTLIASEQNKGLANSIISGVSQVMEKHGKAIVLEDDCVSAPDFLEYMNSGLDFFLEDQTVGAICGYTFLKQFPKNYPHDIFTVRRFSSCAWASWKRVWDLVDWKVSDYPEFCTNFRKRYEFDRCGQDLCNMLDYQMTGKGTSWAIRFDYALYKNKLRSIHPCQTRIKNVGFDEGTHVSNNQEATRKFAVDISDNMKLPKMEQIVEYPEIRKNYAAFFNKNWFRRTARYFRDVIPNLYQIKKKGVK